jgi:hypothetical protein
MNTENPYEPPHTQLDVKDVVATTSTNRQFFDFRCFATALLSTALGTAMWKVQSFVSGNATFDPEFFTMFNRSSQPMDQLVLFVWRNLSSQSSLRSS